MCEQSSSSLFLLLLCVFLAGFLSSLFMGDFRIGTLNLNGAREDAKRAALFKLMEMKKLDILLVQETHSSSDNESQWRREWPGEVVLSHKSSCSGGVGVFFSRGFVPASCEVEEVIEGCLLKFRVQYEHISFSLISVYVPCHAVERLHVLHVLCDTVRACSSEEFLFLGGGRVRDI